jgi:hypothetical protein
MTAISPTSSSSYQSPLQKLEAELQSEVTSGAVSSSDQSALSSALNDINSSLQSGSASDSASAASSSPGDLKSKIDTLIANEWGSRKYSRRAYRQICDIPLDIPKDELERRLSVFGGNHFGMCPTINLHGIEFRAVLPQPRESGSKCGQ